MKEKKHQPAICNGRVSDPKQATIRGDGLGSQERACREHAERKGYVIGHVFTDMMTGERADRPGLKAMMAHLKKYPGTVVIVDHANRLGRDLLNHLLLRAEITNSAAGWNRRSWSSAKTRPRSWSKMSSRRFPSTSASTMPSKRRAG